MTARIPVTLIPGDGIGPEVVAAARRVLDATGAPIDWEVAEAGASVFRRGVASGVPDDTIASIARTRLVLKGPLETPVGFGEKSANVTLRKLFETYANVRPVRELQGVPTPFSGRGIDLVVVRENVEDLYAGIEHQQTPDVAQCLKLISRPGSERVVRLAFELARVEGRRSIACATKANIMKLTEGTLKRVFEEVAPEYPDVEARHIVVDNCAHQLVRRPEQFDVIVTTNMNGDILSDLTSGLIGGLGFAPSANLGADIAIFEAVHGSAPKYAGQDSANPSAVILSGAMLLRHAGLEEAAGRVERAVEATLAAGIHTRDVPGAPPVSTTAFTDAVLARLDGPQAATGDAVSAASSTARRLVVPRIEDRPTAAGERSVVGMDIFVEWDGSPDALAASLEAISAGTALHLKMISNRGTVVYPMRGAMPSLVDHYRCRFVAQDGVEPAESDLVGLLSAVGERHRWMHVERLQRFNGERGYTLAQGEDAA
jgi:isocitrate dehydrogenase